MGVVVAAELVLRDGPPTPFLSLLNSVGILLLSIVAFVRSAALRPDRLLGALVASEPRPNPATPVNARIEISKSDKRILAELARAMEIDRLYLMESLTIGKLADSLGTEEYRLRRLINQHLGYRNFAAFLNSYRLADAKRDLLDPTKSRLPILTMISRCQWSR